ncbi:hypothetical protein FJ251_11560 [bacterium]|nr:hypothetical protein [bacterium]
MKDPRSDSLFGASRRLEEAFFLEQDKLLIERLRAMKKMAETKEALAAVSTITNDAVLARLVELDIKPEIVAALAAVPLVEVAWADGKIDPAERKAVLAHAAGQGIAPGSIEHSLLERWLEHRPEPQLLQAWAAYIDGLCERLSVEERRLLRDELLRSTRGTAAASGGFLGLGRVSAREKAVLERLSGSFGV